MKKNFSPKLVQLKIQFFAEKKLTKNLWGKNSFKLFSSFLGLEMLF
jgi:hypothetical protein